MGGEVARCAMASLGQTSTVMLQSQASGGARATTLGGGKGGRGRDVSTGGEAASVGGVGWMRGEPLRSPVWRHRRGGVPGSQRVWTGQ